MNAVPDEFSRITATAESLMGVADDAHRFTAKTVLLTGEQHILKTENGRMCFLDCIRLLLRMVNAVTVAVPGLPELSARAKALISDLRLSTAVRVVDALPENFDGFDAILSVGCSSSRGVPMTVVNSNGWVARVGSDGETISETCGQANPIGSLAAASIGAAEVFKRLIKLKPQRGELQKQLVFSLFSYTAEDVPGPALLPTKLQDVALCGVGAIGNATAYLLNAMDFTGELWIVDKDIYKPENLGTCLNLASPDVGSPKAAIIAAAFNRIKAEAQIGTVETFMQRCGKEIRFPRLLVNGFDNVEARRAAQDLWPDQIIDGAIGPTSCEVTVHPWGPDLSCLKCDFIEPETSAVEKQMRATGLSAESLTDLNRALSEDDLREAAPDKMEWLFQQRGKPLCSIVQEAVLAMISLESQERGFQPSVPFVASLSACMTVTEMYRFLNGIPTPFDTGFQFDVLVGPQSGRLKAHGRKQDCVCVSRRSNIETMRQRRQQTQQN